MFENEQKWYTLVYFCRYRKPAYWPDKEGVQFRLKRQRTANEETLRGNDPCPTNWQS